MVRVFSRFWLLVFIFILCLLPFVLASAHEVYVLDDETIAAALATESLNPFNAYTGNEYEFYFWGLVSLVVVSTILFASIFHLFEKQLNPLLHFLKRLALPLVRAATSITLIVFGSYGVLYGPEIPLVEIFGSATGIVQVLLIVLGIAMGLGLYARLAALAATLIYLYTLSQFGWYVLSYINHFAAYFFLFVMGSGMWSLDLGWGFRKRVPLAVETFIEHLRPLAFPLLRIGFGAAIMIAAVYAKYVHSELAYQVVIQYELTRYLPFEPLFVVLGAFIIELLAGLMMFLGVAVRWTALFLAFWLTMGHIFTVEAWWVHLILYGIALAIFCHGYDRWSLEGRFLRRNGREPVL